MVCALPLLAGNFAHAEASFEARCADPNVVLCDPLDEGAVRGVAITAGTRSKTLPEALRGKYVDWRWCTHNPNKLAAPPVMDSEKKVSGSGSVKFTIVGGSRDDGAGYCQINFTPDNSVQFGEGDVFHVQFRVRLSCELMYLDCDPASPEYKKARRKFRADGGGVTTYKLSIINAGDHPALECPVGSCTNQHLVLVGDSRGLLQGYHSCEWYDGHWRDLGLDKRTGRIMLEVQPKSLAGSEGIEPCHKADSPLASKSDPPRGCFVLPSDEWLTITQQYSIGRWADKINDPARSSNVKIWVAREGKTPELVIDLNRNFRRPEKPFMKYGKVWLVPFFTNKDVKDFHPTATLWYDELMVARGPYRAAK